MLEADVAAEREGFSGQNDAMSDIIPIEGRDHSLLLEAVAKIAGARNAGPRGALEEAFDDIARGLGAYRGLLLEVDAAGELAVVKAQKVDEADQGAVVSGKSAPGVSATMIRRVLKSARPALLQHPMFLSHAERTGAFAEGETPSERSRNYSAICAPVVEPTTDSVRLVLYLQSIGGPDLRRAYREADLRQLTALAEIVSSWLVESAPIPVMGRDYPRLMAGAARLAEDLGDKVGGPLSAIKVSFEDLVAGFGAARALIVQPEYAAEGRVPNKLQILAHHNVKPEDLAAVAEGRSAPGISSSMLKRAISSGAPELIQHPLLSRGAEKTAAFMEEGDRVRNYSAICAPVRDPSRVRVEAVYYFQSITGQDLRRAYRDEDLQYLRAVTQLVESVLALHYELLGAAGGYTYKELVDRFKERIIRQALRITGNNYQRAVTMLGMSPSLFYRNLERFGIPLSRDMQKARQAAKKSLVRSGDDDDAGDDE